MKKDNKYASALKSLTVHSSIAIRQAQGHLVREFGITLRTAAKATDRIFNGTTDKNDNKIPPLLELSECKICFVDVDQIDWHQKLEDFEIKSNLQASGKLTYIASARTRRYLKAISE